MFLQESFITGFKQYHRKKDKQMVLQQVYRQLITFRSQVMPPSILPNKVILLKRKLQAEFIDAELSE